jgi:hypothetical protein
LGSRMVTSLSPSTEEEIISAAVDVDNSTLSTSGPLSPEAISEAVRVLRAHYIYSPGYDRCNVVDGFSVDFSIPHPVVDWSSPGHTARQTRILAMSLGIPITQEQDGGGNGFMSDGEVWVEVGVRLRLVRRPTELEW